MTQRPERPEGLALGRRLMPPAAGPSNDDASQRASTAAISGSSVRLMLFYQAGQRDGGGRLRTGHLRRPTDATLPAADRAPLLRPYADIGG